MTNEATIASYIIRDLLGILTETEKQELEAWRQSSEANQVLYDQFSSAEQIALEFRNRNERNKRISGQLEQFMQEQKTISTGRVHIMQKWKWIAASVILVLGIGAYLLMQNRNDTKDPVAKFNAAQIQPGRDGAVLTLADGSQLLLDSVQNGIVALQDGVTAKVVNGALVYEGNGNGILYNTMSTPKGRQYQLTLPDGTKVWLNAASSIKYPTAFTGRERNVQISGEAYFEVAKKSSQPFRVVVDNGMKIDVLGTSFNVNAYQDDNKSYTTLIDGAVRVTAAQIGSSTILKPAQQAVQADGSSLSVSSNVDVEKVMAWKNGVFNFENASLEYVMKEIERWYDIDVVYKNGIPDIKFWGKITKDVPLSGMLIALERTKVHFELENNRTLVVLP
ncbi:FecR family protein [Pseudoflavitalea rhizosphaerae]|uniref:FecR family protein n=1 Tax=Pseudoflavitalea rhizosphaerae TaxID=1884793 RepID=UPI000F8D3315|nr:FecR family protein [Pseudoflavitalea rhizosphaerae]